LVKSALIVIDLLQVTQLKVQHSMRLVLLSA